MKFFLKWVKFYLKSSLSWTESKYVVILWPSFIECSRYCVFKNIIQSFPSFILCLLSLKIHIDSSFDHDEGIFKVGAAFALVWKCIDGSDIWQLMELGSISSLRNECVAEVTKIKYHQKEILHRFIAQKIEIVHMLKIILIWWRLKFNGVNQPILSRFHHSATSQKIITTKFFQSNEEIISETKEL